MASEIEAFRAELKAAGEPWQQRGIKVAAAGFVVLAVAQILSSYALLLLYLAILLLLAGWGLLIVAFLRRRRWAKAHPIATAPDPTDAA
jgi:uncharacterized membrane protein HdeD (DUF308 family)